MKQKVMSREELSRKYPTEEVMVVNKSKYGFIKDGIHLSNKETDEIVNDILKDSYFVFRKDAEYNPEYIQLIPYVVIKHKGKYFTAKRIGAEGDVRIIGKITIGMGGHINPCDYDEVELQKTFYNNIVRELSSEELYIDLNKTKDLSLKGLIRYTHPEDLLSQDHLGLLYVLETEDEQVKIKETDMLEGNFCEVNELIQNIDKAENWSRLILELIKDKQNL